MHITWRHVHRQAGANCTDAKLYFWQIFQFFIFIQMGPGPTHPLPNYFWIFGIFLTLQSPLMVSEVLFLFFNLSYFHSQSMMKKARTGRCETLMQKRWYEDGQTACECGGEQKMKHLLVCPILLQVCTHEDLEEFTPPPPPELNHAPSIGWE